MHHVRASLRPRAYSTAIMLPILQRTTVGARSMARFISPAKPKRPRTVTIPAERRQNDRKYPLTAQLAKGRYIGNVQVVSPELCDDILDYMRPFIEQHKGCDIIDINPGSGLWSQRIHEALQPRTHVLMEPNLDHYSAHLQPLLDQPNSRYRHVDYETTSIESYRQIFKDGFFPDQSPISPEDTGPLDQNNSLLVIGNLAFDPPRKGFGFSSMSRQLILKLLMDIPARQLVHQCGPVRMLFWVHNEDRSAYLPRAVASKQRFDHSVDRLAKVYVVSSSAQPHITKKAHQRLPQLDFESSVEVARRMKAAGLEYPSGRRVPGYEDALEATKESEPVDTITAIADAPGESFGYGDASLQEMAQLREKVASGHLKQYLEDGTDNPLWVRYKRIVRQGAQYEARRQQMLEILRRGRSVLEAETALFAAGSDGTLEKNLELAREGYKEIQSKLTVDTARVIGTLWDDYFTLKWGEPRLMWDHRLFEPITNSDNEFWPTGSLTLLDFQPRTGKEMMLPREMDLYIAFLSHLLLRPSQSLPVTLDQLAPGAAEAILPLIPSVHDPMRGGRLDPNDLTMRTLTHEMVEDIIQAWKKWIFAPTGSLTPEYWRLRRNGSSSSAVWRENW